jgi:hypothetical protein
MDYQTKGERFTMKKTIPIAISILLICGVLLLNAGIAQAGNEAYSITENYQATAVTVDGTWGASEWLPDDAWIEYMSGTTTKFGYKMDTNTGPYLMSWAIETTDTTNDAGDIWQICIDGTNDGGTTPKTDDNKIEITGHTTLKVYKGTGTGWEEMTGATVEWKDSMATGHWVLELQADKATLGDWGGSAPPQGLRVAMYDASTQTWVQWAPASTADNPDSWGMIATFGTLPEGLSFGIVALLSTAVIAGAFVLSKRAKSANLALITHK